jgi:hypothetical protein
MRKTKKSKGGAATVMPLQYFDPKATLDSAVSAGSYLLNTTGSVIRPRIGGSRKKSRRVRFKLQGGTKNKRKCGYKMSGGFVPSIMEGFVSATTKYLVPTILIAGYKLLQNGKTGNKTRRHRKK